MYEHSAKPDSGGLFSFMRVSELLVRFVNGSCSSRSLNMSKKTTAK